MESDASVGSSRRGPSWRTRGGGRNAGRARVGHIRARPVVVAAGCRFRRGRPPSVEPARRSEHRWKATGSSRTSGPRRTGSGSSAPRGRKAAGLRLLSVDSRKSWSRSERPARRTSHPLPCPLSTSAAAGEGKRLARAPAPRTPAWRSRAVSVPSRSRHALGGDAVPCAVFRMDPGVVSDQLMRIDA